MSPLTLLRRDTQNRAVMMKQISVTQVYQLPIWLLPCGLKSVELYGEGCHAIGPAARLEHQAPKPRPSV